MKAQLGHTLPSEHYWCLRYFNVESKGHFKQICSLFSFRRLPYICRINSVLMLSPTGLFCKIVWKRTAIWCWVGSLTLVILRYLKAAVNSQMLQRTAQDLDSIENTETVFWVFGSAELKWEIVMFVSSINITVFTLRGVFIMWLIVYLHHGWFQSDKIKVKSGDLFYSSDHNSDKLFCW